MTTRIRRVPPSIEERIAGQQARLANLEERIGQLMSKRADEEERLAALAYNAGFADGVRSIGRKGGAKTSESKTRAARENGRKGGRPRLPTKEDTRRSEEDMS